MKKKKKKKYSTSYLSNNHKYGSHVWAFSEKHAKQMILIRGLGEKIYACNVRTTDGYGRKQFEDDLNPDFKKLNDYEFIAHINEIVHSACFMAMVAFNSGTMTFDELYSDEGIVHQLIHLMNKYNITTRSIRRARGKFTLLQDKAIGMFP